MTSHLGNSADVIFHLASHYYIFPRKPDFTTNTMDFTLANALDVETTDWIARDIIKTMLIYSRQELTEKTENEQSKIRPSLIKRQKQLTKLELENELDIEKEWGVFA